MRRGLAMAHAALMRGCLPHGRAQPSLSPSCALPRSSSAQQPRGIATAAAAAAARRAPSPPGRPPPPTPRPRKAGKGGGYRIEPLAPSGKAGPHKAPEKAQNSAAPTTWAATGLGPDLLAAVGALGLATPTPVQAAAIPALLRPDRPDVLVASHTGSGKTLAYLLPLVQGLRDDEAAAVEAAAAAAGTAGTDTTTTTTPPPRAASARPRRPRALVLGPTRELTDQTGRVAKALGHVARFRSAVANGGTGLGDQAAILATRAPDVLIATPARVAALAAKGALFYGDVTTVVLDEADTMFDAGFGGEVRSVLAAVRAGREAKENVSGSRSGPPPARVVLVAATLTGPIRALIARDFPAMVRAETDSLHRGAPGARHSFIPVGDTDKLAALATALARPLARRERVVVFCNTVPSARAAAHALEEGGGAGCEVLCVHGDMPPGERAAALARFIAADSTDTHSCPPVLVATDIAARGLDIPGGGVDEVLNFDFPRSAVDYLHRAGRTARAGARGRVTSLVAGPRDRTLAARIQAALEGGAPLDGVSAGRNAVPAHMRPKPETLRARAAEAKAAKLARKGRRGAARFEAAPVESGGGGGKGGRRGGGGRGGGRGGGPAPPPRQAAFRGGGR
jgi:superfamily II DNA/RNA helicase